MTSSYIPLAERMKHPLTEPVCYAVMTAARREFDVETGLKRLGYQTVLPFVRTRKLRRRPRSTMYKTVVEDVAYFSRYLFVVFRFRGDNFDDVRSVRDVSTVVKSRMTGRPHVFPWPVIEAIMAKGDDCGCMEFIDLVGHGPRATLPPGSIIEWQPGSLLQDIVATVLSDKGGAFIEVEMAGKKAKVKAEHVVLGDERRAA